MALSSNGSCLIAVVCAFFLAPFGSDTHVLEAIAVLANFELREAIAVVSIFDLLS